MMWKDIRPGDVLGWDRCVDLVLAVEPFAHDDRVDITLMIMWSTRRGNGLRTIQTMRVQHGENLVSCDLLVRVER